MQPTQPAQPPLAAQPLALSSQSLLGVFAFDLAVQWVGWAFASALKTEKFYDLTGSLTFIASGAVGHLVGNSAAVPRARIATGLLCVWASRLGTHLVRRITRDGHDKRFDGVRDNPKRFLVFWTIQGLWVFITSLPVTLLNLTPQQRGLGPLDALGAFLGEHGGTLAENGSVLGDCGPAGGAPFLFPAAPQSAGSLPGPVGI